MTEIKTPYLNIQTDFGFKHVFGSIANKQALIRFLNALFEGKLTVTDVTFHDKEILPSKQDGKRIVYDVYCTTPIKRSGSSFFPVQQVFDNKEDIRTDHHFILEMQNIYTPPFEERIVFYASKMVAGQGNAGWNYELEPVFAVAITDFNFSHLSPKLVRDVMLTDRESGEILTEKLHIFLCSLKEVPKNWEECKTELEHMLFLIKNMENMDHTSLAYKEGNFAEIFEAARSSLLNENEIIAYSQSLEKLRDTQVGIKYAADKARAEARERALAEGRAEGRAEERESSIRIMLSLGIAPETIADKYEISLEDVLRLNS